MDIYYIDDIQETEQEYTIVIYCENVPGVTSYISNLFSRIGVNINSLIGAGSEHSDVYRVIIKCTVTPTGLEKIVKQLHKLINIIDVKDSRSTNFIEYEMSLIRLSFSAPIPREVFTLIEQFQGKIIQYEDRQITMSFSNTPENLQTIINLFQDFGQLEIVNSGVAVLERKTDGLRLLP